MSMTVSMLNISLYWINLFFFFQAEDGIRDHCVTGVQTCALPISPLTCRPSGCGRSTASPGPAGRMSPPGRPARSEEHTSELQSHSDLVCRLLLEKKKTNLRIHRRTFAWYLSST